VVAAQGARIAFDINVAARDLGASLIWSLLLEDGTLHEGSVSTAACAEQWRGETEGTWVTRRRFELPRELPPGYHQFDARLAGGEARRCATSRRPSSPAGVCGASRCSCTRCGPGATGASAISAICNS
jgi:hypothetical protein